MNTKKIKISIWLWVILLFLILCFPRILQSVKIIICVLLIGVGLFENRPFKIDKPVSIFFLLWLLYSIVTLSSGIVQGNVEAGINAFLRVNVFNIVLYVLLISSIGSDGVYSATIKTIAGATFYISVYNLMLIACGYLRINIPLMEHLDATARIGFHSGYTHIVTTNLSMTIMLFPLMVMVINNVYINSIINKKFHILTVVLCGAAMLLSGRRILWISLVIGLYALFAYNTRRIEDKIKYLLLFLIVVILGVFIANRTGLVSLDGLISRFQYAFSATDEYGLQNVRNIQSKYLIEGFLEKPIFGNGAGATISGFQRSESSPWTFELSYHVLLFQSGIFGALFYCSALILILKRTLLLKRVNKNMGAALLFTYLSIIVANATNPYFSSSFDFMIFIFLPLMLCDLCYKRSLKMIWWPLHI